MGATVGGNQNYGTDPATPDGGIEQFVEMCFGDHPPIIRTKSMQKINCRIALITRFISRGQIDRYAAQGVFPAMITLDGCGQNFLFYDFSGLAILTEALEAY